MIFCWLMYPYSHFVYLSHFRVEDNFDYQNMYNKKQTKMDKIPCQK